MWLFVAWKRFCMYSLLNCLHSQTNVCIHNQHPKKHSVTQARQWHWFTVSHFVHYSHIFLTQWLIIRDSGLTGKKERLILLTLATFIFRNWYKDQISIDYYEKVNKDFMVKLQKRRKYRSTSFLKCNNNNLQIRL